MRLCSILSLVGFLLCSSNSVFAYTTSRTHFMAGDNTLRGTLALPDDAGTPPPVVIFVHGDGPADANYYGYYNAFWRALARQGIASFAWDKPGVGDSSGDWLDQDMSDRAAEVRAAARHLRKQTALDTRTIGVIGFSQAGWVLPRLANEPWLGYMMFVSTAIDWRQQGDYLRARRLRALSRSKPESYRQHKDRALKVRDVLRDENASYADYLKALTRAESQQIGPETPMSPALFAFARRNTRENATRALADIDVPVLALFGSDDVNVDVEHTLSDYRRVFDKNPSTRFRYRVFENATHQLTKSGLYNSETPGLLFLALIHLLGERFFVNGALDTVTDFAVAHARS